MPLSQVLESDAWAESGDSGEHAVYHHSHAERFCHGRESNARPQRATAAVEIKTKISWRWERTAKSKKKRRRHACTNQSDGGGHGR